MAKVNRVSSRSNNKDSARSSKPRPSGSKANAAGYAKRHSRKAKSVHGLQASDVYEYTPNELSRRSKITLDLDHEEAAEYGVGTGGDNDMDRDELQARLIGENGEDEMIDSEDDEEIDSDAAFEESDEDRYAGFFSSKGKKKVPKKKKNMAAVRFADVDLDEGMKGKGDAEDIDKSEGDDGDGDDDDGEEEEEEEEEGDDDEFIDLLDVLDGKGEVESEDDKLDEHGPSIEEADGRTRGETGRSEDEEQHDEDEDEEQEEEDGEEYHSQSDHDEDDDKLAFDPSDTDEAAPEALGDLQSFISTLDPTAKKRKAHADDSSANGDPSRKVRRLTIRERTEAGAENEFRAQTSGSKLNLDDLLAPLTSQSSALLSLKKSTKALAPSASSKAKTLSAPLPQRTQERLDREAAYEQTKGELDKWSGTMKKIREAEHLSFPLQVERTGKVSNMELAAKFKPTTALETSVDALLKSAKMREADIHHTEDSMLEMNKLSAAEVAQRRGELRKMRELMFRAEIKARRVGKIKSKTYRKIKRKERERLGEKLAEDDGGSEGEEGRLKREVDRAKERATLKHKHTGKWARQMKGREGVGAEGRKEIEEMLARGEKLRRRINGVGSGDESDNRDDDDDDDDDLDEDGDGGVERIKQGAFDELQRIEKEDGSIVIEPNGKGKSIFDMKFMQDAMARKQQNANKVVEDFIQEMGGQPGETQDSDVEEEMHLPETDPASGVIAQRTGGRVVFRPGAAADSRRLAVRPIGSLASDTSSVTLKSTDLISPPASPEQPQRPFAPLASIIESNPWLIQRESGTSTIKPPRKKNEVVVGKDSTTIAKSKNKLKKQARKREEERDKAKDDAVVEISTEKVLTLGEEAPTMAEPQSAPAQKAVETSQKAPSIAIGGDAGDDPDSNSEIEEQEKVLDLKGKGNANGLRAFEQRDLVALAFAGDNVVQDFEEAKRREVAADAPREVDTTIPGWGSWGGTGTRQVPPKPHRIKKIAGVDPATRADFNKANVIISEKRDKKAAKYLVKDLPYPYTSKAQFERAMERPLGTEWNTRVAFQKGTLPRVVKKPGMIINPLEKPI